MVDDNIIEELSGRPNLFIRRGDFKLRIQGPFWVFNNLCNDKLTIFHEDRLYLIYDKLEYEEIKKEANYENYTRTSSRW